MSRVVQQEQRTLRRKKRSANPCNNMCLLSLMLAPLAIVIAVIYFLQNYNDMVEQENELLHASGIKWAEAMKEKETAAEAVLVKMNNLRAPAQQQQQIQERKETLVLTTALGNVRITMRPDLSEGSVDYIHRLIASGTCHRCNFYRAEKPGILQGVMANTPHVPVNEARGNCPPGFESVKNDCPPWDAQCGCHGPVMTKGAVAWAAGQAGGPDFFIDNYKIPAKFWGTQHTNFGFIEDEESFLVIREIFNQPTKSAGGMTHIQDPIHFDMALV
jgi:hypothetical protein